MPAKPRRATTDYAVYLLVRLVVCVVQGLPTRLALAFAELLAAAVYRFDKRHRNVAAENLRHAFPDEPPAAIDRLVRGCVRHFCLLVVELILIPRKFRLSTWRRYADSVGGDRMMTALLSDRPTLVVTAHFGNWELAGYALGEFGFRTHAIARVLDNPHLERFLKKFRQATGQTIIAKKDDFARLDAVLRAGGKVATLADQDAGPRGVFVDFFGRPASAHKAVALMAVEFGATMVVVGVPRIAEAGPGALFRYTIWCEDVIDPAEYADRPDAVRAITQRYHDALARMIRRHPEQYFWLHRRWKTQPVAKKSPASRAA